MNPSEHLTCHQIDEALAGLASAAASERLRVHCLICSACASKVDEARTALAAFRERNLEGPAFERIVAEANRPPARQSMLWRLVPALGALAAGIALVVVLLWPRGQGDAILFKGGEPVIFWVQQQDRTPEQVSGTVTLRKGDRVQIEIVRPGKARVSIRLTSAGRDEALGVFEVEGPARLPRSLELDSSPEPETLVVELDKGPEDQEKVRRSLEIKKVSP